MSKGWGFGRRGTAGLAIVTVALAATWVMPMAGAGQRPHVIDLPPGFEPEGIVTSGANRFFVGSIPTGAVRRGDLRTGATSAFVPAQEGRRAIGLSLGDGMLFVAGGPTGHGYVYDARTGEDIADFTLATSESFINDVVATSDAAYFTDSVNPVIYRVPIEGKRKVGAPVALPLTGDLVYSSGFNANGIDATSDGDTLVVVQSNQGKLFTIDPETGTTDMIELGGATVVNGDGILLEPSGLLWVLRNRDNLLVRIQLESDLSSGVVEGAFTDESFDVPTTLARAGNRLAIVNARFGTSGPQPADYWVTQIKRPN